MKIISLLIAQVFLFTSLALPEPAANFAHLRPEVGIDPQRLESMTSHMKRLGRGKETRMGMLITQVLEELQPELEDETKEIEETLIYGIRAKVLYLERIGITSEIAYRFLSSDNKIIIVINSSYPKNIQEEVLYEMAREAFWADQGFSRSDAHVISSAELVQEFSKAEGLIAYHRLALGDMREGGLKVIQEEDEKARAMHHKILEDVNKLKAQDKGYGEVLDIDKIRAYEENLRSEAKAYIDRIELFISAFNGLDTSAHLKEIAMRLDVVQIGLSGFNFEEFKEDLDKLSKRIRSSIETSSVTFKDTERDTKAFKDIFEKFKQFEKIFYGVYEKVNQDPAQRNNMRSLDLAKDAAIAVEKNLRRSEEALSPPERTVEIIVLDDDELFRGSLIKHLPDVSSGKIYGSPTKEDAIEALKNRPGIDFMIVDFRLGNYDNGDEKDNGVEFCRMAVEEAGFKGRVVILSADDSSVIRELGKYPALFELYRNGRISVQNKSDTRFSENIKNMIASRDTKEETAPEAHPADFRAMDLIINIEPEEIGITEEIRQRFVNTHVIIADDKEFIRDAFGKTVEGFFNNVHKARNVDEVIEIVKRLRSQGTPDSEILVLSDFEFGAEQTGTREKDGHDLLMALRLHQGLDFKGGFIFVSGSIISKHEIQGYDPLQKDVSEEIKARYGIDYIEKSTDPDFRIKLLKFIYNRLQNPYNLNSPITAVLAKRRLSQPADITFLNGGVNDFEQRLVFIADSLDEKLKLSGASAEIKDKLAKAISDIREFVDFGKVDRGMAFNKRVHNYKGRIGFIGSFLVPALKTIVDSSGVEDKDKLMEFRDDLNKVFITLEVASNYMKRLLDLSSVAGNISLPISLVDLKSEMDSFGKEYKDMINLHIDVDEERLRESDFPNGIAFVLSYILDNAREQYQHVFGSEFKGDIFVKITKDDSSGEPFIIITVKDKAGGIPESALPNIFKRKFTTKERGTGYGLFWAKELVEIFKGNISAGNEDNGAVFSIKLPLDWKEKVKKSGPLKNLELKIDDILAKRGIPEENRRADYIAMEIDAYSSKLAEITARREVGLNMERLVRAGGHQEHEIEVMLPYYLKTLAKKVDEKVLHKVVLEKGVTKEDVQSLFLSLLRLQEAEDIDKIDFTLLGLESGKAVKSIDDNRYKAVLLRPKSNIDAQNNPITPEEREDYQKTIRLIGYVIHKLGGSISYVRWCLNEHPEIAEDAKNNILGTFYESVADDRYHAIHGFTSSSTELTGFEDDRLIIERVAGWKGAIEEIVNSFIKAREAMIKEVQKAGGVYGSINQDRSIDRVADEGVDLLDMLNSRLVKNKRFINEHLASYQVEIPSPLSGHKEIHASIEPGTRLWLKEFFLNNIILYIWRAKTKDADMYIDAKEENGETVFRIRYKGSINPETVFKSKHSKDEPWNKGPLILDLINAMNGRIEAENIDENVEITIRFPLPEENLTQEELAIIDNIAYELVPEEGIFAARQFIFEDGGGVEHWGATAPYMDESEGPRKIEKMMKDYSEAVPEISTLSPLARKELIRRLFTPGNILLNEILFDMRHFTDLVVVLQHELLHKAIKMDLELSKMLESAYDELWRIAESERTGELWTNLRFLFRAKEAMGSEEFWVQWYYPYSQYEYSLEALKNEIRHLIYMRPGLRNSDLSRAYTIFTDYKLSDKVLEKFQELSDTKLWQTDILKEQFKTKPVPVINTQATRRAI